jgi:hypothetical protein
MSPAFQDTPGTLMRAFQTQPVGYFGYWFWEILRGVPRCGSAAETIKEIDDCRLTIAKFDLPKGTCWELPDLRHDEIGNRHSSIVNSGILTASMR